jgi:Protein of unknown function (DUF732)
MKVIAAALATAGLAAIGTGTANADSNGAYSGPRGDHDASALWVDLESLTTAPPGYTAAKAGSLARDICSDLEGGKSRGEIIASWTNGDPSTIRTADTILGAITWHFCPDYY